MDPFVIGCVAVLILLIAFPLSCKLADHCIKYDPPVKYIYDYRNKTVVIDNVVEWDINTVTREEYLVTKEGFQFVERPGYDSRCIRPANTWSKP